MAAEKTPSINRRAEDVAKREDDEGREHLGTKGKSERPHGTSSARDRTGIDPQDPVTETPLR
jgi:hypothetical protein